MNIQDIILLYNVMGNVLYVHFPPKVYQAGIGFKSSDCKEVLWPQNYVSMTLTIINNATPVFTHTLNNNSCEKSGYFNVIFVYPNQTLVNSTWLPILEKTTPCDYSSYFTWCIVLGLCLVILICVVGYCYKKDSFK